MVLYRVILGLLLPVLLLIRLLRGETWADLGQRLGLAPRGMGDQRLWLHGASNGEVTSARWLIEDLLAARPGLQILITSNTRTARQMVRDWALPGVVAALAPVDLQWPTQRLLTRWQPVALISLEAELWPNRFAACAGRGLPVLLIGARMSPRSFRRWQWLPAFPTRALGFVRFASAQDDGSRRHLAALGLGTLGADFDLKAASVARLPAPDLPPRERRAGWLLAASTHDGEEAMVLDAFAAQTQFRQLILAPRHPARAAAVAALLTARKVTFNRRSTGAMPGEATVFLADSMGEMDQWYRHAGACIIGGSFADKGGHTPWEPSRFACALLHGPSTWNFGALFTALDAAGAAFPVTADSLAPALSTMTAAAQDRMALRAKAILQSKGDETGLLTQILTHSRL
ncbi:MAG: glycosyltransferase N-terminal domain-containing protein [bacterium]